MSYTRQDLDFCHMCYGSNAVNMSSFMYMSMKLSDRNVKNTDTAVTRGLAKTESV